MEAKVISWKVSTKEIGLVIREDNKNDNKNILQRKYYIVLWSFCIIYEEFARITINNIRMGKKN